MGRGKRDFVEKLGILIWLQSVLNLFNGACRYGVCGGDMLLLTFQLLMTLVLSLVNVLENFFFKKMITMLVYQ